MRCSVDFNTLQHTATHCNTLQHTATHCNTLNSHRADIWDVQGVFDGPWFDSVEVRMCVQIHVCLMCCSLLQCVAVCCSALECAAVCGSVLDCSRGSTYVRIGAHTFIVLQCVAVCCSVIE